MTSGGEFMHKLRGAQQSLFRPYASFNEEWLKTAEASLSQWLSQLSHWPFFSAPTWPFSFQNPTEALSQEALVQAVWQESVQHFYEQVQQDPVSYIQQQYAYWQDCVRLLEQWSSGQEFTDQALWPIHDRRLHQTQWEQWPPCRLSKYLYALTAYHLEQLLARVQRRVQHAKDYYQNRFFIKQIIYALSPANYWWSNPELVWQTYQSHGLNLWQAWQKSQHDAMQHNLLAYRYCDERVYQVGHQLAITKGVVVMENPLCQLLYYQPPSKQVYERPLLIIPPWINKYYILDLQPHNSLVNYLLAQGHSVLMLSWHNPQEADRHYDFEAYLNLGPLAALNWLQSHWHKDQINVLGYCIGGTLLACLLAYLAAHGQSQRIHSATFLTSLLDFSDPGEVGAFITEGSVSLVEQWSEAQGYLSGATMAAAFNSLRALDLLWVYWVDYYLKQQTPKALDFLYWNADQTNLPAAMVHFYLRQFYLANALAKGSMVLKDTLLNLSAIDRPQYFLAAKDDHIVPWTSVYQGSQLTGGSKRFVLTASGHIAGVVNPPVANKYQYWCNEDNPPDPSAWLAEANSHPGSWWVDFCAWLKPLAGQWTTPPVDVVSLEAAPGRYVLEKC